MSVISGNAFHVSQAVYLSILLKEDVVSNPVVSIRVRAWEKGGDLEFSRQIFFCNRMYCNICNISIVLLDNQTRHEAWQSKGLQRQYSQIESKFCDDQALHNEEHEGLAGCPLLRDYMELYEFLFHCRWLQ